MYMDTENGPSSSYGGRGPGRGWGNDRGRSSRGGRGNSSGRGYYQQDNFGPQGGNTGGRYNGNPSNNYYGNTDSWNSNPRGGYRGRSSNYWGNSNRGGRYQSQGQGRGRGRGFFDDPEDVQFCRVLKGHSGGVTAILVDQGSGQLFTASKDQTVKVWDFQKGQCLRTVEVGGEVDSMLMESGMLFVGIHMPASSSADLKSLPGSIRVYNLQDGAEHALQGHAGPIYALAAANNMLFSGGHDFSIRVWQFNQAASSFQEAAVLTAGQGGHTSAVKCLQVINTFLFSADWAGAIKVWDMTAGQCVQSVEQAHTSIIMSLLAWEGYLLSASVDGRIRIWQPCENPAPGAVIDPQSAYSHPPNGENFGKVLMLSGTTDAQGKSVLLASYSEDNVIRLWQLPDFSDRGHLNAIKSSVAVQCCQQYLFAGDYFTGAVKVWKWR